MGRKIFISYKYKDYDVKELSIDTRPTYYVIMLTT